MCVHAITKPPISCIALILSHAMPEVPAQVFKRVHIEFHQTLAKAFKAMTVDTLVHCVKDQSHCAEHPYIDTQCTDSFCIVLCIPFMF